MLKPTKRKIKFRAWDLYTKKFIDPMLIGKLNFDDETYVFQQFTGVLGKDNKEIFEGDKVRTWRNSIHMALGDPPSPVYTAGEITWLREGWSVCQENIGGEDLNKYTDCDCCPCALEVIGNIFEKIK